MSMKCEIVQDLLPLYVDEVCHEETSKEVLIHLEKCEVCQEYLKGLQEEPRVRDELGLDRAGALIRLKRKLKIRYLKLILTFSSIFALVGGGYYYVMVGSSQIIPYESGLVQIIEDQNRNMIGYRIEGVSLHEARAKEVLTANGQFVLVLQAKETLHTRLSSSSAGVEEWFPPFTIGDERLGGRIIAVYYLEEAFHDGDLLENAIRIWEFD